jgi:glycosyltransferase involved in cell wall biosynthesis
MRIGFDLRPFLKEETGVGVYFRNLLFELARIDREDEFFLVSASWKDRFAPERIPPFAKKTFRDLRWPVRLVDALWYGSQWPTLDAIFGAKLDLTHSPAPLPLPTKGRRIVTVCDLFFLDEPGRADPGARKHFLKRTEAALREADGIVAISEYAKAALLGRFDLDAEKIRVTHLGVEEARRTPPDPASVERTRAALGLPSEFLLFVGASEPRKNLPVLIDALAIVHERGMKVPLVIVGRAGAGHGALLDRIAARGLAEWVKLPGYLPDADLRHLYHAASALVFPSSCEGFGLPLLEAMAAGLPAAVSNSGALPEIGGEAAVYFDPDDASGMAGRIIEVLTDPGSRESLRRRGPLRAAEFRWERTAARTLDFYREVLGRA